VRRVGTRAALRPAAGDLVLLAYPGVIGEPELDCREIDARLGCDAIQRGGEVF